MTPNHPAAAACRPDDPIQAVLSQLDGWAAGDLSALAQGVMHLAARRRREEVEVRLHRPAPDHLEGEPVADPAVPPGWVGDPRQ